MLYVPALCRHLVQPKLPKMALGTYVWAPEVTVSTISIFTLLSLGIPCKTLY